MLRKDKYVSDFETSDRRITIPLLLGTEALGLAGADAAVVAILKAEGGATGPFTIDEAEAEETLTVPAFVVMAASLVAATDVGTLVVAEAAATEVEAEGVEAERNYQHTITCI